MKKPSKAEPEPSTEDITVETVIEQKKKKKDVPQVFEDQEATLTVKEESPERPKPAEEFVETTVQRKVPVPLGKYHFIISYLHSKYGCKYFITESVTHGILSYFFRRN